MSRFRIDHPSKPNIYAEAGHDHMLGFFVELHREGRSRPIKSLDMFTLGRAVTLNECFEFLIEEGFFTAEDLEDALTAMQDGHEKPLPESTDRTAKIIKMFKSAAD